MKRLTIFGAFVLSLTLVFPLPSLSHNGVEQEGWYAEWEERVMELGGLSIPLLAEYQEFANKHAQMITLTVSRVVSSSHETDTWIRTTGVEQWRGLVSAYFLTENVDRALRVMACESGGNPSAKNPRSTASGLYQFLKGWWSGAWGGTGVFDPFDPEANIRAAAWLSKGGADWSHWVCKG